MTQRHARYCRRHVSAPADAAAAAASRSGGGARTWVRRHVLHSDGFVLVVLACAPPALGALFLVNRTLVPAVGPALSWSWPAASCSACAACSCSTWSSRAVVVLEIARGTRRGSTRGRARRRRDGGDRAPARPQPRPAGRAGHPRRLDAGRPARPADRAGRDARAARGLVGRGRAALGGRRVLLRRLPGGDPLRRRHARSRSRSSTSPARASTPAPGRCCCRVPSAACSARSPTRSSCPRPTATSSGSTGRRGSRRSPTWSSTWVGGVRRLGGRAPAGRAVRRRVGPLADERGQRGPAAGDLPGREVRQRAGRLDRGDALLLFTDGLIEKPGQDIAVGIDKLLGEAERLVTHGFRHGARKLIDRVAAAHNDDRAVVLIWRD